jgi:hypothetical protein
LLDRGRQAEGVVQADLDGQAGTRLHRLQAGPQGRAQSALVELGRAQLEQEQAHLAEGLLGRGPDLAQVL